MNPNKTRKVTIKDIMDEYELELMGISVSVDGTPVNSALRISEFLFDSVGCIFRWRSEGVGNARIWPRL